MRPSQKPSQKPKRHAHILTMTAALLLTLLLFCAAAGAEEGALSADFHEALTAHYAPLGGTVLSASAWDPAGAAVIRLEDHCLLSVWSLRDGAWRIDFENPRAASPDTTVWMDTDDVLILSDPFVWYAGYHAQFCFTCDGEWLLDSVIVYMEEEEDSILTEHQAGIRDGQLYTATYLTDDLGNILSGQQGMPLPDVLTRAERSLSAFDGTEPPFDGRGYFTDDSMEVSRVILRRLFDAVVPEGYTCVDGTLTEEGLQFVADRKDGARVLLCCARQGQEEWQITESTPLPAGTTLGIENFTRTLNLSGGGWYGVNVGRYPGGAWGVTGIMARNCDWMDVGQGWISESAWGGPFLLGMHPWGDITVMDWSSVPGSFAEAAAALDTAETATPCNPDPADRLHLRTAPDRKAASLGKYYNGTPLTILAREGDWTKVSAGGQTGYMLTEYLLTGDSVNRAPALLPKKTGVQPLTEILWDDGPAEKWTAGALQRLCITGVIGDEWYLVWDPITGRWGQIRQTALWDGNG